MDTILFEDNFSQLAIGAFSTHVGAHTEYHYLAEAAPRGNWTVAAFLSGKAAGQAWQVQQHDGRRDRRQRRPLPPRKSIDEVVTKPS